MAKSLGIVVRNATLRQLIADRVAQAGGRPLQSEVAIEAFNWAQEGAVEALIIDLHLESMHGDDVCRELKQAPETMHVPVIMLIEEDDIWFRERCERANANAVVAYRDTPKIVAILGQLLNTDVRVRTPGRADYYLVESHDKKVFHGSVSDVSSSGLQFLARECDLESGFVIDVRLYLPEAQPFMGRAKVVRVVPPGSESGYRVHLSWEGMRKGDRPRLLGWIRERMARQQTA